MAEENNISLVPEPEIYKEVITILEDDIHSNLIITDVYKTVLPTEEIAKRDFIQLTMRHYEFLQLSHRDYFDPKTTYYYKSLPEKDKDKKCKEFLDLYKEIKQNGFQNIGTPLAVIDLRKTDSELGYPYFRYNGSHRVAIAMMLGIRKIPVMVVKVDSRKRRVPINKTKIKIKDPLIVMGNGPSLKNVDFDLLKGYDTFGLKGAYTEYKKMNWYPKYWTNFDLDWLLRGRVDDVNNLILNSPIEHFILPWHRMIGLVESPKIHYLNTMNARVLDTRELMVPWDVTIQKSIKEIKKIKQCNDKEARKIFFKTVGNNNLPPSILSSGVIKTIKGEKLTPDDYDIHTKEDLDKPRMPKSFQEFYYTKGNTAYAACLIGILLGYKKIILTGVDCNYEMDNTQRYWADALNNSMDEIEDRYKHCKTCKPIKERYEEFINKVNDSQIQDWNILFERTLKEDFEIINCSGSLSQLEIFPRGILEYELEV